MYILTALTTIESTSQIVQLAPPPIYVSNIFLVGGASAASEATLSSCPLRFPIYVGIVRAINP